MKTFLLPVIFLLFVAFSAPAQKQEQLAVAAQKFMRDYYPSAKIKRLHIARLDVDKKYKLKLRNGTKMIFDQNGYVREIKGKHTIPREAFPEKIKAYLQKNYSDNVAIKWIIDPEEDFVQKITFRNGLELVFDKKERFLKID